MLYSKDVVQKDLSNIVMDSNIPFDMLKGKTVLVTGAMGMIAYYFTCTLMYLNRHKNMEIKVVALVRNGRKAREGFADFEDSRYFQLLIQDVCEPIDYKGKIDYIFHAAGGASPKMIKNDPLGIIKANVEGSFNILELARERQAIRVVYPSTREVYGKIENVSWIREDMMGVTDPLENRSCYPESKRMAEQIFKSYYISHGVNSTLLRIAHVYGPGMDIEHDGRVMSDFISDIVNNRDIVLKSDGSAERAFCYLSDAVRAIFLTMLKDTGFEVYNIANETEPMLIRDVAKLLVSMKREKDLKVMYQISDDTSGYCSFQRVGLDTGKLESLGWKPLVSLQTGLQQTVDSY